ncbi:MULTISPECIES: lipoate--protein ligase family protein [unclassified Arthrobacter]|uniref:lipoate--protein ligase family protein n=1 Tax=unclassified Arthrobacter TaxID=235627 RepID=UPI0024E03655|nr:MULTISPECIES: lipoate--protein ligase family protein [unclassified Arthrobacter]MCC9145595.1 lipoate--protein ligase family protein [Arthrobacter sp. zg-Y919]MDK1276824.1 lipoate--protein ligase family protein [Arthrobacter sp. zg.Y919]WIB04238.1 lipoate--protein ligase family protein [Arthrobacter sp. zg-Y919]
MSAALEVFRQDESLGAAADLDFALAMLDAVRRGELGPALRIYRPRPTVALGQRDAKLPGFTAAQDACRRHGFEPLVRKAGGRAAAYHSGCLIVDHVEPDGDALAGSRRRFADFGELLAGAFRKAGVPAGVGEIPGEYCPGEFTVHGGPGGRDRIKLVGTAQRVVAGAWLFSSVLVVENPTPLRRVLTDCYAELGLGWDPRTAGAASDLVPGLDLDQVEDAVLAAYAGYAPLTPGDFPGLRGRVAQH